MGAAALAGCSSSTAGTQSDSKQKIEEQDVYLPLDGLGQFGEKVLDADMENSEFTAEGIQTLLEPADDVEEEAELLAEITTPDNLYQVSNAYLSIKKEGDNVVAINQNHAFYQDSGPLLEFHRIVDGELHGQPGLKAQGQTHFPGDQGPDYLEAMRTDERFVGMVAQDYDAFIDRVEPLSESEKRTGRKKVFKRWSAGLFGVDSDPNVIPYDAESSNVVFDGIYHKDGNSKAVTSLNQAYAESDVSETDQVVSAQYTGDEWEFRVHEDYEMGDQLPARL
jgi:hypothetical protein